MEEVVIDVDTEFTGTVIDKLTLRKGELVSFDNSVIDDNKSRIVFRCTSRGLLGFRQEFINDTRGTGILNHSFCGLLFFHVCVCVCVCVYARDV